MGKEGVDTMNCAHPDQSCWAPWPGQEVCYFFVQMESPVSAQSNSVWESEKPVQPKLNLYNLFAWCGLLLPSVAQWRQVLKMNTVLKQIPTEPRYRCPCWRNKTSSKTKHYRGNPVGGGGKTEHMNWVPLRIETWAWSENPSMSRTGFPRGTVSGAHFLVQRGAILTLCWLFEVNCQWLFHKME